MNLSVCLSVHTRCELQTFNADAVAFNVELGLYVSVTLVFRCRCRLQATNSSARSLVSIEKSQGFQTVRCLIGC